jgi:hypothetical protein
MFKLHQIENTIIAELTDEHFIISQGQDVLDLMGDLIAIDNCSTIILRENNLHADFFMLQSGLAGEVLQKFSNYRFKLAIIGDFSNYSSQSFQDLIRESNKGNRIFFVSNIKEALSKLTTK